MKYLVARMDKTWSLSYVDQRFYKIDSKIFKHTITGLVKNCIQYNNDYRKKQRKRSFKIFKNLNNNKPIKAIYIIDDGGIYDMHKHRYINMEEIK